jgi:pilus assembly protein CpaB
MEASSTVRRIGGKSPRDFLSSRGGTIAIAAGAAVLAGVLLFVFVQQYRKSVNSTATNTPVFVASGYIPRGTSATLIASGQLMQRALVKSNQVQAGAIADPSVVRGEVTAVDIFPGQQLTAADFTATNVTIASELRGPDRAIAVPVDSAHGLAGFVQPGDHVDVMASFPGGGAGRGAVTVLAQDVLVLSAPNGGGGGTLGGNNGGNIVLRVGYKIAQELAFAADNGKVWITLRPPVGAVPAGTSSGQGG